MGDNYPHIEIPINEWINLYDESGIAVGTSITVENVGSCDIYLAVQDAQPPTNHDAYNVLQRNNGVRLQNTSGSSGAWAFANSVGGKVSVGFSQQDGFFQYDAANITLGQFGDTSSIDGFDRLRVSMPNTIFDYKHLYDNLPLFFDENTGGSATAVHDATNQLVRMTVTANSGDYAIRQTKRRFNYYSGKSTAVILSTNIDQDNGVTKRIGIFDGIGTNYMTPGDGIFLSVTGSQISWNIAKNGTTTETVSQSAWNYDVLDGEGPSNQTLDISGNQLIIIDFQNVGRCRVGFIIDGLIRYVHYFRHVNISSIITPFVSTPNLPIRLDISSDGTGGGYIDHIDGVIMSEAGADKVGVSRSVDTGITHLDANIANTIYLLIALRLKTTHIDLTVVTEFISVIAESNDSFKWALLLNPTYNGTLTFSNLNDSGIRYAFGATANDITDEGIKIDSGYGKALQNLSHRIKTETVIGTQINGTKDELVLAVMPRGNQADFLGSIVFREIY